MDDFTKSMKCHLRSDKLQVFVVENTANRKQHVLATDPFCASWLSQQSGHLKDRANGKVYKIKPEWLALDQPYQSALRRALNARYPGAVARIGDHVTIKPDRDAGIQGGVFTPLSSL